MEYSSPEVKELARALIEVQKEMNPATKDSTNPFCKNRYASINSVFEACRAALLKHNVWLCQMPIPAPPEYGINHIALLTKLTHADSQQWQASLIVVPLPKPDCQGLGSALTYARRYALTAMLGITTEDDDGEAAKVDTPAKIQPKGLKHAEQNQAQTDDDKQTLNSLPKLDGIDYEMVRSQDGRDYIVAKGNTISKKTYLSNAGFKWDPQGKVWWKYADAS